MNVTVSLQEKNGIYQAVLSYKNYNGKRQQKWVSTKLPIKGNKRLATKKAEEIRLEFEQHLNFTLLEQPKKETTQDILFLDYMNNWLKIIKNTIELNTYGSYQQMVHCRIKDYFSAKNTTLQNLQPTDIQNFYSEMLQDGLSSNTVIHYHAIIRKALNYAFKMNMIASNPADKIQKPKVEQYISTFYNEKELNILFEKSKGDPLELIIFLSSFYGLRRSEVVGLKWNAIDFENNAITIKHTVIQVTIQGQREILAKDRTKNRTSFRSLPLVPEVVAKLKQFKQIQEDNKKLCKKNYNSEYQEYLCVDSLGNLIKPDYITKHFKKLLEKNNLKVIRFHELRHSCASLLLARGVQIKEIQEWLGHSNFNTTANIYAHLDTKVKLNSANVLSNIFNSQKNIPTSQKVDISR